MGTEPTPEAPAIPGVTRWRKKPVEIEARLFDPGIDWDEACDVMLWCDAKADDAGCEIDTLEGVMLARPGDWIVKGVSGEFYPVKPAIFAATYEPAGEPLVMPQDEFEAVKALLRTIESHCRTHLSLPGSCCPHLAHEILAIIGGEEERGE